MLKRSRTRNYRSVSSPATVAKQATVRLALDAAEDGLTVAEVANALGCSRQLALYHVKKMAALGQLVMVLEPCDSPNALRFRCWSEMALAARYARLLTQVTTIGGRLAA